MGTTWSCQVIRLALVMRSALMMRSAEKNLPGVVTCSWWDWAWRTYWLSRWALATCLP